MTSKCIIIVGVSIVAVAFMFIMGKMADGKDKGAEEKQSRRPE